MTSPAETCAELAESLADMARQELNPTLYGLLPDARRAAVLAYWLEQLTDLGAIGKTVARRLIRDYAPDAAFHFKGWLALVRRRGTPFPLTDRACLSLWWFDIPGHGSTGPGWVF